MAFSQNQRGQMAYVAETTFGTTPGTPSMIALRTTGHTLAVNKDLLISQDIRSDRQIQHAPHGVMGVTGDISFELGYGEYDTFLEAALMGAWNTNVLKAGTTFKSVTIEDGFMDLTSPVYNVFTGVAVNTMSLNITPNAIVTGSFGCLGKTMTTSTTALDASLTAATTHTPFVGWKGTISEGGSSIASVSSVALELNNGLAPTYVVGSQTTPQFEIGQSNLTGTITAYFESNALLTKFIAETESSLELTLDGVNGGDLTIEIPRIVYSGAGLPRELGGSRMYTLPFQALYNASDATNLILTRTPA